MKDKSGRGNHASQATTAARPLLQQDTGGRYYLSFDGVDDRLTSVGAGSAALTILQAIQWTTLGTSSFAFGNALAAGGLSLFKASSDVLAV